MSTPEMLLFLYVLNLGVAFGAGLYETIIVIPLWFTRSQSAVYLVNTKAMLEIDTGRKFWAFVTTAPLTLLTLANLATAFQSQQPVHDWWLMAAAITLVERLGTFLFFIPIAIKLQKADRLDPSRITSLVTLWTRLNYVRMMLTLIAWVCALRALSL